MFSEDFQKTIYFWSNIWYFCQKIHFKHRNFLLQKSDQNFPLKIIFSKKKKFLSQFFEKILSIFSTSKKLMHENAIKRVGRVIFLENLAENLCFSRVLRLFASCFSCYFGSTFVFFKKIFLATLFALLALLCCAEQTVRIFSTKQYFCKCIF